MSDRVVIIGGTAAGSKAAATARRRNRDLDIHVFQSIADVSYSACGMPYHLSDAEAVPRKFLVARTPEQFARDGIDVRVGHKVEAIDVKAGAVDITDFSSGKTWSEPFDQLMIATGAEPVMPSIPIADGAPPIATLRNLSDIDHIGELVKTARRAIVIGGGYVGLEMVEAFHELGKEVAVAELAPRLLPNFEESVALKVQAHLEAHGVDLRLGSGVAEIVKGGVRLETGEEIAGDLVLMAVGMRPNTELAKSIGVKLGVNGAIETDEGQRTNIEGVYAAGDCVLARHRISNESVWVPLGDIANRQGRVAGENIAGGDARFSGVLGAAIFKVFDLAVATTGLTEAQAKAAGFDAVSAHVQAPTRAKYMPASREIELTLVADAKTARLLGAQAVGEDGVDKAIDTISSGLWGNLTAHDMADIDLAYAPPYSPVMSPVQIVAEVLRKKTR